jgi:hypothetical protein
MVTGQAGLATDERPEFTPLGPIVPSGVSIGRRGQAGAVTSRGQPGDRNWTSESQWVKPRRR